MREFEYPFEEGLRKGLRSEEFSPAREQQLVECRNLKPSQLGLRAINQIENPFELSISWPWPQLIVGRSFKLLADETTIYTCNAVWGLTNRITGLTTGDCWDWGEFGDYLLLTNGSQMVQRNGATGAWTSFASSTDIPGMKTVCGFRGQLIGGNVTSSWYDCGSDYVVWSDIGSASFTPGLRNEAGYMIIPYSGAVLRVMSLGDVVMVYCENGIVALKPAQQYFAMFELSSVGIPCKGAVGGSEQEHVFVDYNGELWRIGRDLKMQKLGYQEYLTLMDASKLMVSFASNDHEYYISDGELGYLLTPGGLCQVHQLVSSVSFVDGELVGVWESDGNTLRQVVTDLLDFGIRSFKTVSSIELGVTSGSSVYAAVDWRSDVNGSFQRSTWLINNPTGFMTPIVTANDFRACVKCSDDMELRYILLRVKNVDKRSMRGIPVSGAGLRR